MKMPIELEKMMFGFIESQVLYTCHNLGILEYLVNKGPASCKKISEHFDVPSSSLERLLSAAVASGLLKIKQGFYSLKSDYISFFDKNNSVYCGGLFGHYENKTYPLFKFLTNGVQEDKMQWNKIDGSSSDRIYQDMIYSDDASTEEFLETMWQSGYKDSLDLCRQYSLSRYQNLVDLGGASGSFTVAALQSNPELNACLMDLEQVKPYAKQRFSEYSLNQRATFITGDMFNDELPLGDIYVIGYVLSDWPDDMCVSLINKCYQSLPKGGLIIILEKHLCEDKSAPYLTAMMNLVMLLEMRGRHRTYSEYIGWLQQTGFANIETVYSDGGKNMLIGKKL